MVSRLASLMRLGKLDLSVSVAEAVGVVAVETWVVELAAAAAVLSAAAPSAAPSAAS